MYLTWLDSNSWLIELGGQRILLDPWLVGDLSFGDAHWLFRSYRKADRQIPPDLDLILLSQGLPDHAHVATLKALDKSIPVVGSPSAAKVARDLGFTTVMALDHDQVFRLNKGVKIQATKGAPVGPTTSENGYLLKGIAPLEDYGQTLYYEPHGYPAPMLQSQGAINVVLTPLIDLYLPLGLPVIQGGKTALTLAQWLTPQVMLPTAAGGDIEFAGLLVKLLKAVGSPAAVQAQIDAAGLQTRVVEPQPGLRFDVLAPVDPNLDRDLAVGQSA
jgi:L-ascorbate metabolism protein UlaG (beta-lactamase superfamily)